MTITKEAARLIQTDALASLCAVAAKHGLVVTQHGGSIAPDHAVLKFKFAEVVDPREAVKHERAEFESLAPLWGLEASDYGKSFKFGSGTYTLCGIAPGRPKNPIKARSSRGKVFVFPTESILAQLGRSASR